MSGSIPTLAERIRDFVTQRFIREQKDSTVKEIAAGLGESEARVRKAFVDHHGLIDGLTCDQEARRGRSSNYPMYEAGNYKVWVYGPTRERLAVIAADAMKERA